MSAEEDAADGDGKLYRVETDDGSIVITQLFYDRNNDLIKRIGPSGVYTEYEYYTLAPYPEAPLYQTHIILN